MCRTIFHASGERHRPHHALSAVGAVSYCGGQQCRPCDSYRIGLSAAAPAARVARRVCAAPAGVAAGTLIYSNALNCLSLLYPWLLLYLALLCFT